MPTSPVKPHHKVVADELAPPLATQLPEPKPATPTNHFRPHFIYIPVKDLTWSFDDCEAKAGQGVVAAFVTVLKGHGIAKAVFFMTGNCYYSRPDLVKLIRAAGYTIGNHTKSHADLTKLTATQIDAEIAGGPPGAKYFRPPYGASNALVDSRIKAAGLIKFSWGASGGDSGVEGLKRSCDRILEDIIHTADPGDAVLLHMYNPSSPPAVDAYLSGKPSCED